jgi:hypothetical protein
VLSACPGTHGKRESDHARCHRERSSAGRAHDKQDITPLFEGARYGDKVKLCWRSYGRWNSAEFHWCFPLRRH